MTTVISARDLLLGLLLAFSAPAWAQSGPPLPTPSHGPSPMPTPIPSHGLLPPPTAPSGAAPQPLPVPVPGSGVTLTPVPAPAQSSAGAKLFCEYRRANETVSYYVLNKGMVTAPEGSVFDYWFKKLDGGKVTRTEARHKLTTALLPGGAEKMQGPLKASEAAECGTDQ